MIETLCNIILYAAPMGSIGGISYFVGYYRGWKSADLVYFKLSEEERWGIR